MGDEEIRFPGGVMGFYDSLDALKKMTPDDWKQIAAECIFEEQALGN